MSSTANYYLLTLRNNKAHYMSGLLLIRHVLSLSTDPKDLRWSSPWTHKPDRLIRQIITQ